MTCFIKGGRFVRPARGATGMSAACKSCGASIVWARTATGKAMPVDAAPSADGNIVLVETRPAWQAVVVKGPGDMPNEPRRRSHFSTCVNAAAHRKPKEKRP